MTITDALYDAPGPRGRRRMVISAALAAAGLVAILAWVAARLQQYGEFDAAYWRPFTDPGIQHTVLLGALATLRAAAAAIVCAIALGALLAVGRLSDHGMVRTLTGTFVELARAVPLLVLMLILFFAFPQTLGAFGALVLGLTLYNGAVLAEAFRAGINAVPRGQREAAYALGMRKTQVMVSILMPQAIRTMLPTIISQCVVTLKDTALGYIITYDELLSKGKAIFYTYHNIIPTVIVIATLYVGTNLALSSAATSLQRRRKNRRGAQNVTKAGPLPQDPDAVNDAIPAPALANGREFD